MKKLLLIVTSILLSVVNLSSVTAADIDLTYCNEPIGDDQAIDYTQYDYHLCPEGSLNYITPTIPGDDTVVEDPTHEYERLEKIDGVWYGIIHITEVHLTYLAVGAETSGTSIYIKLDRELKDLVQITFDYEIVEYCRVVKIFGWCPIVGEAEEGTITIIDEERGLEETIEPSELTDFDYRIKPQDSKRYDNVTAVDFKYILTDQEVINVNAEIKLQFINELEGILNNPLDTQEEKNAKIALLHAEYLDYHIDYDEILTSICEGEACTGYNETPPDLTDRPGWLDGFEEKIGDFMLRVGLIFGGLVTSGMIIYTTGYILLNKTIKGSGALLLGLFYSIRRVGRFWGEKITEGLYLFVKNVGKGLKTIFTKT